jgi:ribose 5-phosphate isomerase B
MTAERRPGWLPLLLRPGVGGAPRELCCAPTCNWTGPRFALDCLVWSRLREEHAGRPWKRTTHRGPLPDDRACPDLGCADYALLVRRRPGAHGWLAARGRFRWRGGHAGARLLRYAWYTVALVNLVVGADHAGFPAKRGVIDGLSAAGHRVHDVGTTSEEPVDFPDIATQLCQEILDGRAERGILICGTGIGACMAANKVQGMRAAVAHDIYSAHQCVEHDNANVLCLGAQIVGNALMGELISAFLLAEWQPTDAFLRRVRKLDEMDRARGRALPPPTSDPIEEQSQAFF